MRLLIAEVDLEVAGMLRHALERAGHAVDTVTDGAGALWMAGEVAYDAILLDVDIPPPDGFEVCRQLRDRQVWAPVIFLTGRGGTTDKVLGLNAGGDDYLVKPFPIEELDARLRAVSRRGQPTRPAVLRAGDLELDPGARRARRGPTEIALTPKEFSLLELLVRHAGEALSRERLHETLWDFAFEPGSNVIDALVLRLRRKLDPPAGPSPIETIRGFGYRWAADS